jgi:hypothetical protein
MLSTINEERSTVTPAGVSFTRAPGALWRQRETVFLREWLSKSAPRWRRILVLEMMRWV